MAAVAKAERGLTERLITFGAGCVPIPERLLLAHAKGEVLFITGAGTSMPAGLPDFRRLVLLTYETQDPAIYAVLQELPADASTDFQPNSQHLRPDQRAEVQRFIAGDYDIVLGMLERRMDGIAGQSSTIRSTIIDILRQGGELPSDTHKSLMKLSDRGGASAIITTNFDTLLEHAATAARTPIQSYSLNGMPRPSTKDDFAGIFHIHGALSSDQRRASDILITDQDFGEFYLRRRGIPDFIYDAARLYHLVLVGYTANDAPMRYLLNAVAADGARFTDLKERFTFVGGPEPVCEMTMADWRGRGITPIPYSNASGHAALGTTLHQWSEYSAILDDRTKIDRRIKQIVVTPRAQASDQDKDLFDHFMRRAAPSERARLALVASKAKADLAWLDAISVIMEGSI